MLDFLIYIVNHIISLYATLMLIYCLLTWVIRDPANKLMMILGKITEPPLKPIKRFLWRYDYFRRSPIDFSPLILFFLLRLAVSGLNYLAYLL